jgi:hypothetical protein
MLSVRPDGCRELRVHTGKTIWMKPCGLKTEQFPTREPSMGVARLRGCIRASARGRGGTLDHAVERLSRTSVDRCV